MGFRLSKFRFYIIFSMCCGSTLLGFRCMKGYKSVWGCAGWGLVFERILGLIMVFSETLSFDQTNLKQLDPTNSGQKSLTSG